jgi:lipopolysaccharide biosynthesis glycosyltransferase
MNIVTVFSPDWLEYALVEMFALLTTNKIKKVYLLSDGLREMRKVDRLFDRFKVEYTYIDMTGIYREKITTTVNVDNRFTKYTLYRLLIPYVVPEKKVLYLDGDAIVIGDIREFYETSPYYMTGCEDTGIATGYKTQIGMKEESPYLNAGVILLNLENAGKLADEWVRMACTAYYTGHDQDIWNITMGERSLTVPNDYNSSLSTGFSENIKICHYAGKKPWSNKNVPHYNIWEEWSNKYANENTDCRANTAK